MYHLEVLWARNLNRPIGISAQSLMGRSQGFGGWVLARGRFYLLEATGLRSLCPTGYIGQDHLFLPSHAALSVL